MAETIAPIERHVRYATNVTDLPAAWAFVMEYMDKVGDSPSIEISPMWVWTNVDDPAERQYQVAVSGTEEEGRES